MLVGALARRSAAARSSPANGAGDAPTLTVGSPARGMTQPGARDLDPEDLAGMGDDEVTDPLRRRGPTPRYRMLGEQGLLQGAPFDVREAHGDSGGTGKRFRGPSAGRHGSSDMTRSGRPTRDRPRPGGARRRRA